MVDDPAEFLAGAQFVFEGAGFADLAGDVANGGKLRAVEAHFGLALVSDTGDFVLEVSKFLFFFFNLVGELKVFLILSIKCNFFLFILILNCENNLFLNRQLPFYGVKFFPKHPCCLCELRDLRINQSQFLLSCHFLNLFLNF